MVNGMDWAQRAGYQLSQGQRPNQANPWGSMYNTPFYEDNSIGRSIYGAPIPYNPFGGVDEEVTGLWSENPLPMISAIADTRDWRTNGTGWRMDRFNNLIGRGLEGLYAFMNPASANAGDLSYGDYAAFTDNLMQGYTGQANQFRGAGAGGAGQGSWLGTDGLRQLVSDMYNRNYDAIWDERTGSVTTESANYFLNTLLAGAAQGLAGSRLASFSSRLEQEFNLWQTETVNRQLEMSFRDWILYNSTALSDYGLM